MDHIDEGKRGDSESILILGKWTKIPQNGFTLFSIVVVLKGIQPIHHHLVRQRWAPRASDRNTLTHGFQQKRIT